MKKQAGADRRGFLAILGLGSVAGPGLVKDAVAGGNFNSIGRMAGAAYDGANDFSDDMEGETDDSYNSVKRGKSPDKSEFHKGKIKSAVESFNETKNKGYMHDISYYIKNVRRLDSDLLSNRSLSLYARLRLQAIRNAEEQHKANLSREERYIHTAVKKARSFLSDNECFDLIATNIIRDKTKPLPTMEMFLKVIGPRKDK